MNENLDKLSDSLFKKFVLTKSSEIQDERNLINGDSIKIVTHDN